MKIVQITAVVENKEVFNEGPSKVIIEPYEDATVYGLGDDNKLYYYGEIEPEEDAHSITDRMLSSKSKTTENAQGVVYGWKPYGS